jgi:hypothetical protein
MRRQRAHQQLLRETHLRMRRHLECAQLHQAEPRTGCVGRVELVDAELGAMRVAREIGQQVPENAIRQPQGTRRRVLVRDLIEGDLQLVDGIGARQKVSTSLVTALFGSPRAVTAHEGRPP